jgi:DNA-binding NtrC family response regulator
MAPSILVVDDDLAALGGLVELLKSAGYDAVGRPNFEEAVRALETARPDLLVADIRLGEYNGLHLILRSRASHPGMASIVISAHPDPTLQREAAEAGASAFLLKPLKLSEFLATVARVLGERP